MKNKFCGGCKNFDEEDCGGDIEVFDCDYRDIIEMEKAYGSDH